MVLEQITRRLDDLDGSQLDDHLSPITFALEGVQYEIDLSPQNAEKLRRALEPFIHAGRVQVSAAPQPASRAERLRERQAIREWARANGLEVSDRGRISETVLSAYAARAQSLAA